MIKKTFSLAFLFLLSFSLYSQNSRLKEAVGIIRPVYSETTKQFLSNFADQIRKEGYDSLAVSLKRYAKGSGFGSGFVVKSKTDSVYYMLTNRHVVAQAQYVNLEFQLADKSVRTFSECKITGVDLRSDIALIELPKDSVFKSSMEFAAAPVEDAEDVYSAGFPGLMDKPSWQIGKGIVSNSNLLINDGVKINQYLIQHTAQIDPGSSGGPLLRKDNSTSVGFFVLGINTLKAADRENTNFAIPVSTINGFLDRMKTGNALSCDSLKAQAARFIELSKSGYRKLEPLISNEMISGLTLDNFYTYFDKASKQVSKDAKDEFNDGNPIETIRIIMANVITEKMNNQVWKLDSVEAFSEKGPVTVCFLVNGQRVQTSWLPDQGIWKLSGISSIQMNKETYNQIARDYGYSRSLMVAASFGPSTSIYEAYTGGTYRSYLSRGMNFGCVLKNNELNTLFANMYLGVQLPYRFSKKEILLPNIKGIAGLNLGNDVFYDYGYRVGLDYNKHLFEDSYFQFGLGYRYLYNAIGASGVGLSVGITF